MNWNAIVAVLRGYPVPVPSVDAYSWYGTFFGPSFESFMACPVRDCGDRWAGPVASPNWQATIQMHLALAHPEAWSAARLRRGLAAT